MLPTFLGIGVAKAGTTWLHELLTSHPHIWMPSRRKEVGFFNNHFHEDRAWYERFFPDEQSTDRYKAIGEITPGYFACARCPERIAEIRSVQKFVLSLRDPVARLYSAYGHRVRNYNFRGDFEAFMEKHPEQVERGLYGRHFKNYLRFFDRNQFLILRFEHLFDEVEATKKRLAQFLGVDHTLFPEEAGHDEVNATYVPRFQALFALAQQGLRFLRRYEQGWLLRLIHESGVGGLSKQLMGRKEAAESDGKEPLTASRRARLMKRYRSDIEELEELAGLDCSTWKADHQ